jgi:hypothetical protein
MSSILSDAVNNMADKKNYIIEENRPGRLIRNGDGNISTSIIDYVSWDLMHYLINPMDKTDPHATVCTYALDLGYSTQFKVPELGDNLNLPTYYRRIFIPSEPADLNQMIYKLRKEYHSELTYANITIEDDFLVGKYQDYSGKIVNEQVSSYVIENDLTEKHSGLEIKMQTRVYQRIGGFIICTAYQIPRTDIIEIDEPEKESIKIDMGFQTHLDNSKQVALVANDIFEVLKENKLLLSADEIKIIRKKLV